MLFAVAGEGAYVVAPRMAAGVTERRSATARTSSALMGWKMLIEWPELAADPALGLHGKLIGWRRAVLE
jgi:hypothetical protein